MKLIQVTIVVYSLFTLGCTAGGGGSNSFFSESPEEASAKVAQKDIESIQTKINTDSQYALNSEEAIFLSEQGIVTDETELKGWVK